jgi:dTDP-4-amino-4,6-dideoxygalactose transaminase
VAESIPLVDVRSQHAVIEREVLEGWARVVRRTDFILGEEVRSFEERFAASSGVGHCIGVANGTDALELALRALGVGPGDEVILPANSFVATAEAVLRTGARPALVDVVPDTYLIDADRVDDRVGPRTRAIVPVHLFGQMAPVDQLEVNTGDRVMILEDAAQAQGAKRHGVGPGVVGAAAATSFYPGKNLGAYGDGGAVLTNDDGMARLVRQLGNHGSVVKYDHPVLGFNSRLDTIQAVVLLAKLSHLEAWNRARQEAAHRYDAMLEGIDQVVRPAVLPGNEHVWHLYVIRVPHRDRVLAALNEAGIGAGVHYPVPIHLQRAMRDLGHGPGDFPVAETAASEMLSLPMFPHITADQQERVVGELRRALP